MFRYIDIVRNKMTKALWETQTLCAGCSKAEPKIFAPAATDPLPEGAQDGQNLISCRWSLPSSTDPVWWRSMHAISSYRGNRPTNKHTNPQTNKQTGPITIHCAAKLSAQCKNECWYIWSLPIGLHHKLHKQGLFKQGLFNLNVNWPHFQKRCI